MFLWIEIMIEPLKILEVESLKQIMSKKGEIDVEKAPNCN